MRTARDASMARLGRWIVATGAIGGASASVAAVASAISPANSGVGAVARGLALAVAGAAGLIATAWILRRGFVAAGVHPAERLVPLPPPRATLAGVAVAALLLGLFGARLDGSGGDHADEHVVSAASAGRAGGSGDADRSGAQTGTGGGGNASGAAAPDGQGSDVKSGSASSDDDGDSDHDDGTAGSQPATGAGGSTPTTIPKGGGGVDTACAALDDYAGDADALLDSLGIDEDEVTDAACDEIEEQIEALENLLGNGGSGPDVPVPTTLPSLPGVTVPTVPITVPVPTTLPPITVPGLP